MKVKHLLITVIILTSLSASAQINKGSIFLGGHIGFWTNKSQHDKSSSFGISPAVGVAVKENLVAGVDFTFNNAKTEYGTIGAETINRNIGAGIFLRQYAPLGKGFYLFGQGRVGGARSTNEYASNSSGPDAKGFDLNLGIFPGIAYSVNRKLQLEIGLPDVFNLSYSNMKYEATATNIAYKSSGFLASTSVSSSASFVSVGMRVFLNRRSG